MHVNSVKIVFHRVRTFAGLSEGRCHRRRDTRGARGPGTAPSYTKCTNEGPETPVAPWRGPLKGHDTGSGPGRHARLRRVFSRVAAHGTPSGGPEPSGAPTQHHRAPGQDPGWQGFPWRARPRGREVPPGPPPAIPPDHSKQPEDTPDGKRGTRGGGSPIRTGGPGRTRPGG